MLVAAVKASGELHPLGDRGEKGGKLAVHAAESARMRRWKPLRKFEDGAKRRLAFDHECHNAGVAAVDGAEEWLVVKRQRVREWNEQPRACGMARERCCLQGARAASHGIGDGDEQTDTIWIATFRGVKKGSGIPGLRIGDGDEQPDTLEMSTLRGLKKGSGIAGFGIRDGDEHLDTLGASIHRSETEHLVQVSLVLGGWNEQFDAFEMSSFNRPMKRQQIVRVGVGPRDEESHAFGVAVAGSQLQSIGVSGLGV